MIGDHWQFAIDENGEGPDSGSIFYANRIAAETSAFTEAFGILNNNLVLNSPIKTNS